jgi:aryl-alcohol dehydrogenase-like predicted oxidoreductase
MLPLCADEGVATMVWSLLARARRNGGRDTGGRTEPAGPGSGIRLTWSDLARLRRASHCARGFKRSRSLFAPCVRGNGD